MDILEIRQLLRTRSIYDLPLRVGYYARVSSESDEQLNSLSNQVSYYEEFIKGNKNWTYVGGYVDEGISGVSTRKRENFNRMVADAKKDEFDLIITKEISRFARNTLDSLEYTRKLLLDGVGVMFQNDNINTFDEDAELRLTIMSSIAQDELRKLSGRVKFGHQQAIKEKVVLGNSRIFGYVKQDGRLVIDEEQAVMVRELFELYATDKYSMKQIEEIFWNKGYRNLNGKKIAHSTMAGIIANPKYKGYYVGNKVKVVDMFTKKQKFLPPEQWVMFKDESGEIVPSIVSEELWEAANEVLVRRSEDVKNRKGICNHPNLLTGKLYCTCCGSAYYRRESKDKQGNKNSRWVCSGKINNGAASCDSFAIYEEEIKPILYEVLCDTKIDAKALVDEYIRMYRELDENSDIAKRTAELNERIETANKKKSKLLEYNVTGQISDKDFIAMNKQCTDDIAEAERLLRELDEEQNSIATLRSNIAQMRSALEAAEKDAASGVISKEFIDKYIDKIYVTPESDKVMKLSIKIFTGKSAEVFFSKLRERSDPDGRMGHTFKKMIEKYERDLASK